MNWFFHCLRFVLLLGLAGCTRVPEGIKPVENFELNRYLGTWYEVARLDHSFERGLERVTAEYSLREDGGVRVINRGYSPEKNGWKEIEGKAYFVDAPNVGHLKVSFFGPFYSSYVVFDIDPEYSYAFVSGYSTSYLWLLSRTPNVSDQLLARFTAWADELGFDTDKLIYVKHDGDS